MRLEFRSRMAKRWPSPLRDRPVRGGAALVRARGGGKGAGRRPRPGRSREPGHEPAPSGLLPVRDRAVRGGAALVRARGGGEGAGRRPRPGRSREPGQEPAPGGLLPVADRAVRGGAALVRARGGGDGAGRRPRPGRSREPGHSLHRWATACRASGSTRRRGPGSSARWRSGEGRRPRPGRSREPGQQPAPGGLLPVRDRAVRGGAALVRARGGGGRRRATSTAGSITRAWAAACTRWATACRRPAQYEAARPWFERAVAEAEQGDVHGRVDHESLGISLHQVGYCLSQTGAVRGGAALVRARGGGEGEGRRPRPGRPREPGQQACTRWAYCLSETGQYEAARPWFERAVAETEQGDVHGRVDHESLGSSLHQVGYCLSQTGQYEAARPWFERAVAEAGEGRRPRPGRSREPGQRACIRWATACRRPGSTRRRGPGTSARWRRRSRATSTAGSITTSLGNSLHLVG